MANKALESSVESLISSVGNKMKISGTELIEFFGVAPIAEDPEEKEFFGSSLFEVTDRDLKLSVSFGSHHDDVSLSILSAGQDEPVLRAKIEEISEVRVSGNPSVLEVVGQARGSRGSDPEIKQRLTIALTPLRVTVED